MASIPSPVGEAHPTPRAPVLADLAPAEATRVTVCDDKHARGVVRALRPKNGALTLHARPVEDFPFIDPVTAGTGRRPGGVMWVLTVDMDHDDSLLRLFAADVPQPSWIIEKGRNGHVQAGWIIEHVTVGPNARPAPIAFAEDVRAALTAAVGGDPAFTNRRQWNPTWTGWATEGRVIWGPTAPRSLGALRAEMIEHGTWPSPEVRTATGTRRDTNTARALVSAAEASMTVEQGERNQFVFDYARLRRTGTVAQAAAHANSLCAPPLPAAEVAGIIRSIERYEARQRTRNGLRGRGHGHLSDAYRRRQAERGRIGGSRGTAAQRAQRVTAAQRAAHVRAQKAAARAAEAHQQAADGATTAQIAERMGVTARTVRTWLNQPPAQRKSSEHQGALARASRHHPSPALAPVRSDVQRLPSVSGTRYAVGGRKRCPHDPDPDPPDHPRRGHRAARTAPGHPHRT